MACLCGDRSWRRRPQAQKWRAGQGGATATRVGRLALERAVCRFGCSPGGNRCIKIRAHYSPVWGHNRGGQLSEARLITARLPAVRFGQRLCGADPLACADQVDLITPRSSQSVVGRGKACRWPLHRSTARKVWASTGWAVLSVVALARRARHRGRYRRAPVAGLSGAATVMPQGPQAGAGEPNS